MKFKQTITWHTADEKPDRKRCIIFIDKEDAYPTPIIGYCKGDGNIEVSNSLPGLNKITWDRVLCWMELSDFLYQFDSQCRRKTMTIKEMREELVQICSRTRVDCEECIIFDCCHLASIFHTPKCMTNTEIKRVYAAYQEQKEATT